MPRIDEFKARMHGGGARPNQFRVYLTFPTFVNRGGEASHDAQFLCKSTMLPGSIIEDIIIPYRGRHVHFAGERVFQPWHVYIYQDHSFRVRNRVEEWQRGIQNYDATEGITEPSYYQVQLTVDQLDRGNNPIKRYEIVNAYPTVVGPIILDYDQQNTIEIFDVEFVYDYFTSNDGAIPTPDSELGDRTELSIPGGEPIIPAVDGNSSIPSLNYGPPRRSGRRRRDTFWDLLDRRV